MRVTRIEIFGFKSFMERLVLPLEGGVTGIVGPNGCGKSNVVDALRWVLGETRASNLRGEVLEDVIFNGTEKLRPLGLAEVTVTLRASDNNLFADLVSPSLEAEEFIKRLHAGEPEAGEEPADGASEPADSENALAAESSGEEAGGSEGEDRGQDKEPSRPQLTVLKGGTHNAPEAQDNLLTANTDVSSEQGAEQAGDDAAEASAADSPSVEGSAPASGSISLLTRFAWLKSVNEVQVTRRLYRSGESEFFINRVACRLKDLREFFRAVGLGARAHTIVAQGEVSRIVTARPEERRLILEEAAGVLGFRDKIASANRRLEETAAGINRLSDVINEVSRQVGSLKRQAAKARNREELKSRIRELETALFRHNLRVLGKREKALADQNQSLGDAEQAAQNQLQAAQTAELAVRNELLNVDVQGDALRGKMDSIKEELGRRARQRAEKVSRLNELRAYALSRETEISRQEERKATLTNRHKESAGEIENLEALDNEISEKLKGVEVGGENELREISSRLDRSRNELRRIEQACRDARDKLIKNQSQMDSLQEQIIAASPISQLKKTAGSLGQEFLSGVDNLRPFIDSLKVPTKLTRAVHSILGEKAGFLLSTEPHTVGKSFIERVMAKDPGNKRGLGLGVFRSSQSEINPIGAEWQGMGLPMLLEQIEISAEAAEVARSCFGSILIAENIEEAIRFFENNPGTSFQVVTLDGDILTSSSFYSFRHDGGILQLKNRADEIAVSLAESRAAHEEAQKLREEAQKLVQATEGEHADALRRSRERQAKIRELSNQQGNTRGRLQASRRLLVQLEQDIQKVSHQVSEARAGIEGFRKEEAQVRAELEALVPDEEHALNQELENLKKEWAEVDQVRKHGRDRLSGFVQQLDQARKALDDARNKISQSTLESQKIGLERSHLVDMVEREYGPEAAMALLDEKLPEGSDPDSVLLEPAVFGESSEELARLRQRIIREGEVDPSSIEQCESEIRRLDELIRQRDDLESAAGILRKTVEKLRATSEERFVSTFTAVERNFARLVPRLFGGGKAELKLSDPSKPLESGIDIVARPPGKKPKSIDLLSGGEKALCATALIFSMFLEKPSPLCVLDEVDAPLDEANLIRFLTLIKEMSVKTQFLMITHNRQSMSMADNLVGVTMQEPGASKVITVSLQEAYNQVA